MEVFFMKTQIIIISLALFGASAFSAEIDKKESRQQIQQSINTFKKQLNNVLVRRNDIKQQLRANAAEIFQRFNRDGGDVFEFLKKQYGQPNMDQEAAIFYLDRKGYHPDVKKLFKKQDDLYKQLGILRSESADIQKEITKLELR